MRSLGVWGSVGVHLCACVRVCVCVCDSLLHLTGYGVSMDDLKDFRQVDSITAGGLLLATPMILRHPFFRTPLGRAIEIGGAAALIAKSAAIIRDWEPAPGGVATGSG